MVSPFVVEPSLLTAAAATYATCPSPAGQFITFKKVTLTNTSASAVPVTIYKVPSGGTAGTGTLIASGLLVPASSVNGGLKEVYELANQTLAAGDTLQAYAGTASVVVLNASGILQTT